MKLEIKKVYDSNTKKMYRVTNQKIDTHVECIDDKGKSHSLPKITLDFIYGTGIADDNDNEICSEDIIEVEFETFGVMKLVIKLMDVGRNDCYLDFYPKLHNPSLGVGYLLSNNVKKIKILGNAIENPERY